MGKWDSEANGVSGTMAVLDYEQDIKSHVTAEKAGVPEGTVWAVVEVKNCSTGGYERPTTVVYTPAAMTSQQEWAVPAED